MALEFFNSSADLQKYAPQIKSDSKIGTFAPYYRPAKQKIVNLISEGLFNEILAHKTIPKTENVDKWDAAVQYISAALANLTAIPYYLFEAGERNNTDNAVYRYQEEAQKDLYLENAHTEINYLLNLFFTNTSVFIGFTETEAYKQINSLVIKSAFEFNKYVNISKSYYFYMQIVYIMQEVQDIEIKPRAKDYMTTEDMELKKLINKAIAYESVAVAIQQLDLSELPKSIRGDIARELSAKKGSGDESEFKLKSAKYQVYHGKALEYLILIENSQNEVRNDGDFILDDEDLNDPSNKHFIIGG
jgi:hypothetical protein